MELWVVDMPIRRSCVSVQVGKYHTIYKTWHNGVLYRSR
jgi:hypothetical protein